MNNGIPPISTDYNLLPPIPAEEKKGGITFRDNMKSLAIEFVILGIYLKIALLSLIQLFNGDRSAKIDLLKHRVSHLRHDDNDLEIKRKFREKILTPSRNIVAMEEFKQCQKNANPASDEKNLRKYAQEGGFCLGATVNFAERILPLIHEDNAAEIVEKIAYQYKTGMKIEDVAIQILYQEAKINFGLTEEIDLIFRFLEEGGEISHDESEIIKDLLLWLLNPVSAKYPEEIKNYLTNKASDSRRKEVIAIIKKIDENFTAYRLKKGAVHWSKIVKENIKNSCDNNSKLADWLPPLVKLYAQNIDRAWKIPPVEKIAKKRKWYQIKLRKRAKSSHKLLNLQRSLITDQKMQKKILTRKGIKLTFEIPKMGLSGYRKDAAYMEKLGDLDPGVYAISFFTASSGHATLFINLPKQKYFWDPNFGLFSLDNRAPQKTILEVLDLYDTPSDNQHGDHDILIARYQTDFS